MASFFIRSGTYYLKSKNYDGKWSDKTTGIKVESKGSLRKIQLEVAKAQAGEKAMNNEGKGAVFSSWVSAWMDYNFKNSLTLRRYHGVWPHLVIFLERHKVKHPSQMTYQLAHEYMRWRSSDACKPDLMPCGWNTALTELHVLSSVMQEAVRRGYIIASPMTRLGISRRDTKPKREITAAEIATIEDHLPGAREWIRDAWLVAMKQGCRLSECAVPVSRINESEGEITFHVKGGKEHAAPLHRDLLPLVHKARKRKSGLLVEFPANNSTGFVNWLKSIGVYGISFHYIRVTVITRLARAGYSEQKTMAYIGHSSAEVHAIYTKLKSRDVRDLGDVL